MLACSLPRFLTDPNTPGVEKLAISALRPDAGLRPQHDVTCQDLGIDQSILQPQAIVMVKGWARSVAAVTVMLCLFECEEMRQAGDVKSTDC